jgi:hypothetical protein
VAGNKLANIFGAAAATLIVALAPVGAAADNAVDPNPDPGPPGGTLIQGGELSGTAEIDFDVDPAGVYTGTITVDSSVVGSAQVSQGSGHLYLDTATLVDGSHSVLVTVSDADASDTVWSGTIETLNAPQGGIPTLSGTTQVGQTLTAAPGNWSPSAGAIGYQWQRCDAAGADCAPIAGADGNTYELANPDLNAELEVEVTASDASGATVATSAPTTPVLAAADAPGANSTSPQPVANGTGACATAHLAAALGTKTTQTVALGKTATLHGELDCNGSAIGAATLAISLARSGESTSSAHVQIQTAADGSFSYLVPAGPSRDITVSYSELSGAATPTALATVSLRVTPKITLRITPSETSNGHTISFAGRVLGGDIGPHGLPLDIEYREGSKWMTYTELLANATTGRYRWHYTFERTTESITYSFRVAIPATGVSGYPYWPAASPARSVHVEP